MVNPVLRDATKEDVRQLYGKLDRTFYGGITAELDGKVVGINGWYRDKLGNNFIFARITDDLRPYKLTIWKAAVKLIQRLDEQAVGPVYAIADPSIPKSDDLLMKMGFNYHSHVPGMGDLYEWTS